MHTVKANRELKHNHNHFKGFTNVQFNGLNKTFNVLKSFTNGQFVASKHTSLNSFSLN